MLLTEEGKLIKVKEDLYFPAAVIDRLQQQLTEFEERNRHLESEIESARQEAESRNCAWGEQQNQLQAQLDEARARGETVRSAKS